MIPQYYAGLRKFRRCSLRDLYLDRFSVSRRSTPWNGFSRCSANTLNPLRITSIRLRAKVVSVTFGQDHYYTRIYRDPSFDLDYGSGDN